MSSPVINTDVPVMVNGRVAQLHCTKGMLFAFPRHPVVAIAPNRIAGCVHGTGRIGVCLTQPTVLVPGTKKGVSSFILTWSRTTTDADWKTVRDACSKFGFCYDNRHVKSTHSMCNRTDVQLGHPVVVWTNRTCKVVDNVELAVLQRTKGGMSTFDVHLVPKKGKGEVQCIEMLPHSMMDDWADLYPDSILDAGPDPLHPSMLEHAQEYGKEALLQAIDEAASSISVSDSASEWEMSDEEDSSSYCSVASDGSDGSDLSEASFCSSAGTDSSMGTSSSCSSLSSSSSCSSSSFSSSLSSSGDASESGALSDSTGSS